MPPDFLTPERKKKFFSWKHLFEKKYTKTSKWRVCRSIVNRPLEEQVEQNWVPCLKQISLNIAPCFAIKWLKYTCNKVSLSIQMVGKCIFVLFWNFFPFIWRAKLVNFFSLQTVALCYLRSWNLLFIFKLYQIYLYFHG